MNQDTFLGLVNNAALLLALAILYDNFPQPIKAHRRAQEILTGIVVGLIGIAVMLTPWHFSEGVIFDTRSILLSVSGYFFGLIPTLIGIVMTSILRILQGGEGALTGVAVIVTSASLGVAWKYLHKSSRTRMPRWYEFYGFGVIVHVAMLLWMLTLPRPMAFDVLGKIALPVLIIYPLGTLLLGLLLARQCQRNHWEQDLQQERDLLAQISETSLDAILLTAPDGRIYSANPAACRMFGRTEQEIIQLGRSGIIDSADPRLPVALEERARTGRFRGELTMVRKDGQKFPAEISSALFKDQEGRDLTSMIIRDITRRKQAEQALQESEEKFKYVFDHSVTGKSITLVSGEILVNQAFSDMLGYSIEELQNRTWQEITHPDDLALSQKEIDTLLTREKESISFVKRYLHKNGSIVWAEVSTALRRDADGKPLYFMTSINDITARKQVEARLLSEKAWSEAIISAAPNIIVGLGEGSQIMIFNKFTEKLTGFKTEEVLGKPWIDLFIPPEQRAELYRVWEQIVESSLIEHHYENPVTTKTGEQRLISWNNTVLTENGQFRMVLSIGEDITERKRAEEALRESEARFRRLAENAQDLIYRYEFSPKRGFTYVSSVATAMTGYTPEDHYADPDLGSKIVHPEDRPLLEQYFQGEGVFRQPIVLRWVRQDGSIIWAEQRNVPVFDEAGNLVALEGIARDITERKRAENEIRRLNAELEARVEERTRQLREAQEQLVRQEKLAVLGQMAGGVGHELRNPLAVINNAVFYLKLIQPDADEKVREYLGMIERETHTAEKIINDLLDFSRVKSVDREPASVKDLLARVLERFPAPEGVRVTLDLPEGLPRVFADPRQVEQVLGNLVVNACQAMPGGGQLIVSSSQEAVEGSAWVRITVRDTGVGIAPENLPKIFEPLFTTKVKGIGLGLAVSKKLIEANGGRIEVESEPGKGATFSLVLPAAKEGDV